MSDSARPWPRAHGREPEPPAPLHRCVRRVSRTETASASRPVALFHARRGVSAAPARGSLALCCRPIAQTLEPVGTALYFLPERELTLLSWLKSYRGKRVYAYAAWDDPKPLLVAMRRVLKAGWRRLRRRLSVAQPERLRHAGKKPKHMEELLLAANPTVGRSLRRVDFE